MVLEWNDVKIGSLISFVKGHPALYDASEENYVNKDEKQRLWEVIGGRINITARNCRRKWTGLCMKYQKLKEAGSAVDNGEMWPWYESMTFIDPDLLKNGADDNVEETTEAASGVEEQRSNNVTALSAPDREQDRAAVDISAMKDMLTSIVGSLSMHSAKPSAPNSSPVVVDESNRTNPPEMCSIVRGEGDGAGTVLNANKLFLESLLNDMCSLSVREQYDFKVEVLVLLRSYLLRHKN